MLLQNHVNSLEIYIVHEESCLTLRKFQAIKQMQAPSTRQERQSFLHMVNDLGQFITSMSDLTTTIKKLLKRDVLFQWTKCHEDSFQKLKDRINNNVCLQVFDTTKPVTLQVHASKVELGAVVIQQDFKSRDKPVAFASKGLTQAETRHATIRHEMLTVVFGCM